MNKLASLAGLCISRSFCCGQLAKTSRYIRCYPSVRHMCTASRGIRSGIYKSAVMPAVPTINRCCRSNPSQQRRTFSSDMALEKEVEAKLKDLIRNEKVLLLIKGTPEAPLCGFSATMINILDKYKVTDYAYIDVYSHELIRPCAKKIANWPTFPQLYISGEFIGGCDVTKSLDESGDLAKLLADAARDC